MLRASPNDLFRLDRKSHRARAPYLPHFGKSAPACPCSMKAPSLPFAAPVRTSDAIPCSRTEYSAMKLSRASPIQLRRPRSRPQRRKRNPLTIHSSLAPDSTDCASFLRTTGRPSPTRPDSVLPPALRRPCPVFLRPSRPRRISVPRIHPRPTSCDSPRLQASPWRPTATRATGRDIFRPLNLDPLLWLSLLPALPSACSQNAAAGRSALAAPNTS